MLGKINKYIAPVSFPSPPLPVFRHSPSVLCDTATKRIRLFC